MTLAQTPLAAPGQFAVNSLALDTNSGGQPHRDAFDQALERTKGEHHTARLLHRDHVPTGVAAIPLSLTCPPWHIVKHRLFAAEGTDIGNYILDLIILQGGTPWGHQWRLADGGSAVFDHLKHVLV